MRLTPRSSTATFAYGKVVATVSICLLSVGSVHSQHLIQGRTETAQGDPIAYVNIYYGSSTQSGTVSNPEGRFRIAVPSIDTLRFSHVGYVSRSVPVASLINSGETVVVLSEATRELDEVIVMPRDVLRELLAKAFSNIEKNYPVDGTLITGFYREANQLLPERSFLYFSESIIQFYKPSYENKQFGPVKILEGAKSELASRNSYSNVSFYAGVYVPQRFDFVKERMEFIDPERYDLYEYAISGTVVEGKSAYKIKFTPKLGALYSGEFYLEKETLAYTGGSYEYTALAIRRHNQRFLSSFNFTSRKLTVQYREIDTRWNIFLVFQEGVGKSEKSEIRYTNEYVSTLFEPGAGNDIKEPDAIPYSGVYTQQNEKFSDDFWEKSGAILRTTALDSSVNFLLKTQELQLKTPEAEKKKTASPSSASSKYAARISASFFSGIVPVQTAAGIITVSYGNAFTIQKENEQRGALPTLGYEFRYTTARRISVTGVYFGALSQTFTSNYVSLGGEWSKVIFGWRKPVYVLPGVAAYYASIYQDLGITSAASGFEYGSSKIPAGDITVLSGEQTFGFSPSFALGFTFRPRLGVYMKVSMPVPVWNRDVIAVRPYSENDSASKSITDANSPELQVTLDGTPTTSSGTGYPNYRLIPSIGLRIGI